MMATLFSVLVALAVSALAAFVLQVAGQLPVALTRISRGAPLLLGVLAGFATLTLTGGSLNLIRILVGAGIAVAVLDTLLAALGSHRVWRVIGQAVVMGAAMVLEWKRGDLFLTGAVFVVASGIVVMAVITFATEAAAQRAPRTPAAIGVLAVAYLLVIALGIPNPGLLSLVALVGAALLPLAVLPGRAANREVLFAPLLAALAWTVGVYAWLANASPAMVFAPIAIIIIDVLWTLTRRLTTSSGRERLAAAGNWWRGLNRWFEPADDLIAQRVGAASSQRTALAWLFAATVASMALGWLQWRMDMRWLLGATVLGLLGLGWVLLQHRLLGLPAAEVFSWLTGLSVMSVVIALGARLTDGRLTVSALPVVVAAALWLAVLAPGVGRLLKRRRPRGSVAAEA